MYEWNCLFGDYSSVSDKIGNFSVTTVSGVSVEALSNLEFAEFQRLMSDHVANHPGHFALEHSFKVPQGYEVRDGIIYKSADK